MIWISHRGNFSGPNPERENKSDYINEALAKGYDVEIDVWFINSKWFLGHDGPTNEVSESFLLQTGLWCHSKNLDALIKLSQLKIHCFFHHDDEFTMTSRGVIWGHVKAAPPEGGIHVLPELSKKDFNQCLGVCSDYVESLKKLSQL